MPAREDGDDSGINPVDLREFRPPFQNHSSELPADIAETGEEDPTAHRRIVLGPHGAPFSAARARRTPSIRPSPSERYGPACPIPIRMYPSMPNWSPGTISVDFSFSRRHAKSEELMGNPYRKKQMASAAGGMCVNSGPWLAIHSLRRP